MPPGPGRAPPAVSLYPATPLKIPEGGCHGRATAPLELGLFLIPSWLLSHSGWQLLMGAWCPQGASSSREDPHPTHPPLFPVRDPNIPLHRDPDTAFRGHTIKQMS